MSTHARRALRSHPAESRRGPSRRTRDTGDTTVDLITNRSSRNATAPQASRPSGSQAGNGSSRIDERNLRVRFALDRLPEPRDRAIIVMRFFLGLSLPQIAGRLRVGLSDVTESYRLSLRILAKELRGWLE